MTQQLENLLKQIELKLDRGESSTWQGRDFENLNERILKETGISLSESTLRRLWGKVEYHHMPSTTTLDTLAKFAGYQDWRHYQKSSAQKESTGETSVSAPASRRHFPAKVVWSVAACVVIGSLSLFVMNRDVRVDAIDYSFSSEPVTRDIPNSVIFKYDVTASPTDSVFIQQSWDERTRVRVEKARHTYTSVYYEPGFYQAKLLVGRNVVKEHPLMVGTNGWLGMIDNKPVPVYLPREEYQGSDRLQVTQEDIATKNITMQPTPCVVKYYNIGNFKPVPVSEFSFASKVRNDYSSGSSACQISYIILVTDGAPIMIPLSARGCVSEIFLRGVDTVIMGKQEDLSGFGVDFSNWVDVACKSAGGQIKYTVNGKEVYSLPLPAKPVHIVGLGYYFMGTGSVKEIRLSESDRSVFADF